MPKTIKVALSTQSIDSALKEIESYKQDLKRKTDSLIQAIVQECVDIARAKIVQMNAVMMGELLGSIQGVYDPATGIGVIFTDCPHAVFVEFGTGSVGSNSPHPDYGSWKYDSNNHGEAGWWYFGDWDGNWHWTKGMPSRPFLWETAQEISKLMQQATREVFK